MMRGFEKISTYEHKSISLPGRKTKQSAGYDLAAAEDVVVPPSQIILVPTGLKAYMQPDEYLGIHIRSGLSVKRGLSLINGQGIIDSDYYNNPENEGHIMIALYNHSSSSVHIQKGERIAQGVFYKYLLADNDDANESRSGGFGSTGNE
ncbi:deoxyuridine 5'-triphosphate nucleotidohydrolase [Methylomusa anaerophila]|uniref:dUTP diphosphatase n=2 Tax=Methylomusa anaerophila TaxID=1930071 RepID=A0A348APX9_9FIRM|nr:deoxyuridine 5'-triphosphate nucleotidohydrolase [Methylomusa anaerophila]